MRNFVVKLFINSVAVLLASYFMSGHIHISSYGYAIVVALTLSLLNVSVKPLLILFTLPATILSLGLFLLVINAAIIELAAYLIGDGFRVDGWLWAFLFSVLLSILNSILENIIKAPKQMPTRDDGMQVFDKDGNRIA
jgi:putative membrane protein